MDKKTIELGGKTFEIKVNFKKSYNLTKFRNRISVGFDFSKADKKVVEEIISFREKNENKDLDNIDLNELSPAAIQLLTEQSNKNHSLFNYDEIIEIVKELTDITNDDDVLKILDDEIVTTSYDELINKLIEAISMVFMSAKDTSVQKAISKEKLVEVADHK